MNLEIFFILSFFGFDGVGVVFFLVVFKVWFLVVRVIIWLNILVGEWEWVLIGVDIVVGFLVVC